MNNELCKFDLSQFTGTEEWFSHYLVPFILYTEGAKFVAEKGKAHWLLDTIVLAQVFDKMVAKEGFQHWKLQVNSDKTAILVCKNGNGKQVFHLNLEFTDFPLNEISFFVTGGVIMLPNEY